MIEPSPMENLEENTIEIYSNWKDKGELVNGGRITLVADKTQLEVGDTLEVLHVFEWIVEGQELFVMGPKEVPNEFVNGKLQTKAPSDGDTYPWVGIYDGVVLPSPGLDANWLPSRYVMEHAGTCTVQWKAGSWTSNELVVQVR